MSKTVECPIKRWPGRVVFKDPIPLADIVRFEAAINSVRGMEAQQVGTQVDEALLPGLLCCVEAWELGNGFAPDPFPGTPRVASSRLIAWIVGEVVAIYKGDEDDDTSPLAE